MKAEKAQQQLYAQLIAEHCTDSIVVTDAEGKTLWTNDGFRQMSGFKTEELVGKKPGHVLQGPETDGDTVADIRSAIAAQRLIRCELLNYHKTGAPYWIDLTITPVFDQKGRLTHYISIERDITEVKRLSEETRAALARETARRQERKVLYQMFEWLFSAQTIGELTNIVAVSMRHLFGDTTGALYIYSNSRDSLDRVTTWGEGRHHTHIMADDCWALRKGKPYAYGLSHISIRCQHIDVEQDGPYFCLPIVAHGDTIGLLTLAFDESAACWDDGSHDSALELATICAEQVSLATASVRLQEELKDRSLKDSLTGLWNRRWFLDMATRELNRANSGDRQMSIAILDADEFKKFNDVHGHDAGDAVLKTIASIFLDLDEDGVFPARIGGEEFALIFAGPPAAEALDVIERLRDALSSTSIAHNGVQLPKVTMSAGLASRVPGDALQDIMKRADDALYTAKSDGRNCVRTGA